ncbi:MAG TPA: CoB--CoM heterodisulfide reductase iron-sulfur subunit A family protein [Desulfotomaculum sp.]|nr:MAG: 4Fe-4S ferredoxin [Desulfotomaculum sp. BICA1-6]HBX24120.1 CoB--CoM heterodisulfide reductase iron-sulfur subunit A family protein [Desulfotomaculum sp.]
MSDRRIGVYICHCGGNISDYVNVETVRQAVANEPGVVVAKTAMFSCSDATQQEMIQDIREQNLDGLVVASCSPKLHLPTFREVARRAGLNPYRYTQVNIREQCSWTHTNDHAGATEKAVRLVRAGIARTNLTDPLQPIVIDTVPAVLVVGAGIAGLRAAVGLADLGLSVYLVEKSPNPGGRVGGLGAMYPHGKNGRQLIDRLVGEVRKRELVTLFTNAEMVAKSGTIGSFNVKIRVGGKAPGEISVDVGAIVVATGFDNYQPAAGEYGYGMDGVITLPEFKKLLDGTAGELEYNGRQVKDIVYIYCVGSRQQGGENPNKYCSRYCCNAAVHASLQVSEKSPRAHQFHLYRDVRTYGKYELMYNEAREKGAVFCAFGRDEPPGVASGPDGKLVVTVRDLLTYGEELAIPADLVVLVTGMVSAANSGLTELLKLPLGQDRFFNEIHPKLRPVETMVDGVFICGTCQGPKNSSESVASALAAVSQGASILKKGYVELEPLIAEVDPQACDLCGDCLNTCPYSAIEQDTAAIRINSAQCKGCGGCAPVCPKGAINLKGYTDSQVKSMIDALLKEI